MEEGATEKRKEEREREDWKREAVLKI